MDYQISEKMKVMKPSAIREIFKSLTDPSIISFSAGNPAPESFPTEAMAKLAGDIFRDDPISALQYGITEGYPALREDISARLTNKFGIGRDFDSTIVVTGGQQGIELACKVLCNEGDTVISENPSFIGALNAFRSNGMKTVGVPLDDDGINIQLLETAIKDNPRAKMIYLIPTFQNPAGITTSEAKRRAVYDLAKKYGLIILEDNPYGELRFAGEEIPTIKSFDEDGIVIYCSSFSKILSAGMRVGYVCAPNTLIQKMVVAKQVEDVHTNMFFQILTHRFIKEYDLDAHINGIRALYRRKCSLMLETLDAEVGDSIKFTRPQGGLFVWCTLPSGTDLTEFVRKAISNKVAVVPGTAFNADQNAPSDSFRITYATPSDEQIVAGVKAIKKSL
ncbi:MAG: PLP-dependent aminotransferase family protein [Oscillospiraceae bacterium]|nr:PLP-dependent aminotransferase family protein [Oscillospiraceae bacterium]